MGFYNDNDFSEFSIINYHTALVSWCLSYIYHVLLTAKFPGVDKNIFNEHSLKCLHMFVCVIKHFDIISNNNMQFSL